MAADNWVIFDVLESSAPEGIGSGTVEVVVVVYRAVARSSVNRVLAETAYQILAGERACCALLRSRTVGDYQQPARLLDDLYLVGAQMLGYLSGYEQTFFHSSAARIFAPRRAQGDKASLCCLVCLLDAAPAVSAHVSVVPDPVLV